MDSVRTCIVMIKMGTGLGRGGSYMCWKVAARDCCLLQDSCYCANYVRPLQIYAFGLRRNYILMICQFVIVERVMIFLSVFFINYNIVFPLSFFISFLQYSTLRSSDAKILGAAVSHKTQGGHCSRWESSVLTFVFTFDAVIFSYYDCVSALLSSSIVFCRLTEDSLINCSYILS